MRLIDADALKKAITEHCRSEVECLNHFWYDENIVALIDNEIKSLVDILDKERPQGEWLCVTKSTFPQYQPDEYMCSKCKKFCHIKYYYCPFCGADMRGDSHG